MGVEVELQRSLYTVLTAAGLRVHDAAPQVADGGAAAVFPYVEVGFISIAMWDTFGELGFDAVARIHTRSRSAGMMECKTLQGQIYDALHRATPAITGHRVIELHREMTRCDRVSDDSYHGVCEYRALIEKT